MSVFVAYHGVTAAIHQTRVDELAPSGFRLTSLSVSGAPQDARYAAVWQQRPGPGWVAVHGLRADQYQTRFDELTRQGFAPVLVTATGAGGDAIFAAVFEADITSPWFARHGLRWDPAGGVDSVNFENQRAFDQGFIPRCLAVYGSASNPLFAGVWVRNDKPVPWAWSWADPDTYQRFFDAQLEAGTRLAYVSVAPSHWMLAVFRDEPIGEWWARHAMTAAAYQAEFDLPILFFNNLDG